MKQRTEFLDGVFPDDVPELSDIAKGAAEEVGARLKQRQQRLQFFLHIPDNSIGSEGD